jgi:hypothetical protein
MGFGQQYPIWNKVTACIYKGSKSYGVKETGETEICIGSSSNNSHTFLTTIVTQRTEDTKYGRCKVFTYSVDDVIIKRMYFDLDKRGRAKELIKTETKLNKIKSL